MQYKEITLRFSPLDPYRDLLIDSLGNEGPYDSFMEVPDGLKAYVSAAQYDETFLREAVSSYPEAHISYIVEDMPDKNWNEEWEKQHQPVLVEGAKRIWVRAPFHEHRSDVDFEIEIEPKMSFGTAHHPTTAMMLSFVSEVDVAGKSVLDMGCGTAVLGILAKMRGARYVQGIDIDEWAYSNAMENAQRNGQELDIRIGDASLLTEQMASFDLVIANINRNILMRDMASYRASMRAGGTLLLSGFYESDVPVLCSCAESLGLVFREQRVRDSWASLRLTL